QTLVISTPNPFARNWVQKHYVNTIAEVVAAIVGHPVEIQVTVATMENSGDLPTAPPEVTWPTPSSSPRPTETASSAPVRTNDLNPKAVFSR
ncbi:DnaA N-terminal domain-containing protein, partial [Haemophilus parainfluenzae]|uniref:DnaA N-terminal domain-containing protein n=1 Tax=Haemophilus parainfluenzae TaxID=729 RepID=UPI00157EE6CB